MTVTLIHNLAILRLITSLLTCIQTLMKYQFQRVLSFIRSFAYNWLDFPFYNSNEPGFSSNFLKNHGILPSVNSENGPFLSSKTTFQEETDIHNGSTWRNEDTKKLREHRQKVYIFDRLENNNKIKTKKENHDIEIGEDKTFFSPQKNRVFVIPKKIEYMSSTILKLEDYNRLNREYLHKKFHSGVHIDDFLFIHPSAKFVDSKSLHIPGAYLLKTFKVRASKRKAATFRPTDLSTIFENLAY